LPTTLQQWLRHLSDVRSRVLRARTADEVLETLAGEVVPRWADHLSVFFGGGPEHLWTRDDGGGRPGASGLPDPFWEEPAPFVVWIECETPAGSWWSPVDISGDPELPAALRVAVPLRTVTTSAAVLLVRGRDRASWTAAELAMVNECVRIAEHAFGAAEQQRRSEEARATSDAAAHRWAAFARLSDRLARSVDFGSVAAATLESLVPYLADWAILDLFASNGAIERIGHRHADPQSEELTAAIRVFPFGGHSVRQQVERLMGGGWLLPALDGGALREIAGPGEEALVRQLAPRSVAVVPLVVGKQLGGALTLVTAGSGQEFLPGDMVLFDSIARQTALALNGARLFRDAERARMEREEALAVVSHDLKNPLNILGFAVTILGQEGIPQEKKLPQLAIMERAIGQMEELVGNLLDAARIDAGRLSLSPAPIDTAALVGEALQRAAPLAERAKVRLQAGALEGLPPLVADRGRVMQVFANLLENAISFTPAGGGVLVRAESAVDRVRFEIQDSGPGVDSEAIDHVFDRFWQARHTGRAGAGLGLAIARGIVEAHGGTIGVRSEPGHGAVFHFTLPSRAEQVSRLPAVGMGITAAEP
jgi:signal transduction histidine kinase